ncbi:BlaI/MecI/CopY family transcriptional regulator [Thalassotalea eurytherma]|uniref:Transcriptional regulator n=1 Tax=Thalassotalea eurytherma TaxID=1144278 RepID=A0ABQ6H178_9GAMM|nr:BlaI/MecI/CopY family transcriptional regulator [Thalassotalea eurytherma]GLX81352.1 transcriptional regulator [Thalassotalea eurytherma]
MIEISKAEFEVLNVIWQQHPLSAAEIVERLNEERQWHEKTVKTLLNRLVKKEALGFEKEQRRYLYYPLIERESYQEQESSSLVQRLFSGKLSPLVAGFAKHNQLEKEDVESLKALISSWEKEND